MLKFGPKKLDRVFKSLEQIKVFTLDQLVKSLGCSIPTARKKLKQCRAHTSYNQNGRYYTMPAVVCFDENGLWHYEKVSFSKHGNLKNTIVHLVNASASGLSGKQIGNLVRLQPRSFLYHFRDVAGIQREKRQGVYVYFSADNQRRKQQYDNRSSGLVSTEKTLSDVDIVVILSAIIKHHSIGIEDIVQLPEVVARDLSRPVVHDFLDRHGLIKKTLGTKQ